MMQTKRIAIPLFFLLLLSLIFVMSVQAAPQKSGPIIKHLSFHNAEIKDIFYLLSKNSGINIIFTEDSSTDSKGTRKLTMNLKNIPFYTALDLVTATAGLTYTNVGSTVIVGKSSIVAKNFSTAVTEKIKLNYAEAYKMKDTLVALGVVDFENIFVYGEMIKDQNRSTVDKDKAEGLILKKTNTSNDKETEDNSIDNLKVSKLSNTRFTELDKASSLSANILVVRDTPANLVKIRDVIKSLDQPAAKIMVEAKVVEINESGMKEMGIDWLTTDTLTGKKSFVNTTFGELQRPAGELGIGKFLRSPLNFVATIKAQVDKGNAKLLSSPRISTLEGKPAFIYVGDKIPYITSREVDHDTATVTTEVAFLSSGITLEILPIITDAEEIQLKVYSEVSSIKEWQKIGDIDYPVPSMRQTETITRVHSGETIIIGGLIYESEKKSMSKIPILGDIPILKSLFRWTSTSKDKTEVVISLTPHVLQ